jgi:hypothetical protein
MSSVVLPAGVVRRLRDGARGSSLTLWTLLAVALLAALEIAGGFGRLEQNLGDVDDALRLVQVREFLAGAPWQDPVLARLGGPEGFLSHWSRLIDLPLALLISGLSLIVAPATAELWVRAVWPFLVLTPLMLVVAHTCKRRGGRLAGLLALGLAVACPAGLIQFTVGRVDHHSAQIAGGTGAVLLLWCLPRWPAAGWLAGLAGGIGVAIGYETLPHVAAAAGLAALWAVLDERMTEGVRAFSIALAAALAAAFVLTISPARWSAVTCDALAVNIVLLAAAGAIGLHVIARHGAGWSAARRLLVVAGAGGVGLVLYGLAEPACLAGPLGQVPKALKAVWLDHVVEAQPVTWLLKTSPAGVLACLASFALGLAALDSAWRRERRSADLFLLVMLVVAGALACWQIKYLPYAVWLAVPPLALALARLPGVAGLSAGYVRFAGLALANQWALLVAASLLLLLPGMPKASPREKAEACFTADSVRALAALPAGRLIAPIDHGSHILALTPHSALAGPYHRLGPEILATHALFSETNDMDIRRRLAGLGADYVAICAPMQRSITPFGGGADNLDSRLRAGRAPEFLEAVALAPGTPFLAWRFRRDQ